MILRILVLLLLCLPSTTTFAKADVSLRNGNFFATFLDLQYPGGLEPSIESTYNSLSNYKGPFGFSWGFPYGTQLTVELDGSILVMESGGGQENRFVPKNYQAAHTRDAVKKMVEIAKKNGMLAQPNQVAKYEQRLNEDATFRSSQVSLFVAKNWMPKTPLKEGAQLTSLRFNYQYITKLKNGFIRVLDGGSFEKFDEAGRIVQKGDRNKNYINFGYDANGRMVKIEDQLKRKMVLSYNELGLISQIVGTSGKKAAYQYSKEGMLISRVDQGGIQNTFKYSNDPYKLLIEIGYPNEKDSKGKPMTMQIDYYGKDRFFAVKSVKSKDGTVQTYDYILDHKDPNHYTVKVVLKNENGSKISDSQYEYFSKKKSLGEDFTWKMIEIVNGYKTETLYDEKTSFPVKITANDRTTTFAYDAKGHLTQKKTASETVDMTYHPKLGKVTQVVRTYKDGEKTWSQFGWDEKTGNLLTARNSDKKQVKIIYDSVGRMAALLDQKGRKLTFRYNDQSKPIEISDSKLGKVKFTYKNSGEVDKIDSSGGPQVASEVLQALQGLTEITEAAGVSFSL